MEMLDNILEFFNNYGWPGIVAIVLILVIYWLITKKDKSTKDTITTGFDKLATSISNQNEHLIDSITRYNEKTQTELFNLIKTTLSERDSTIKSNHNKSLDRRFVVSEKINDILWDIMNLYNCQRTIVIEFHNSKENLNGLSFLWYDVQYEKQQRCTTSISNKMRNLQASNILPIINRVNSTPGNIIILNPDDIEKIYDESTVLYSQFKELNIEHIIYSGIYSSDNKLIGLVALEYQKNYPYHEDIINLLDIKGRTAKIAQLLQFSKNNTYIDTTNIDNN